MGRGIWTDETILRKRRTSRVLSALAIAMVELLLTAEIMIGVGSDSLIIKKQCCPMYSYRSGMVPGTWYQVPGTASG